MCVAASTILASDSGKMTKNELNCRKASLTSLIDDPSPLVRTAVREECIRLGKAGLDLLRCLCEHEAPEIRLRAMQLLKEISAEDTVQQFERFIASHEYELETGALLLARTVDKEVNAGDCCAFLDEVALRCRELLILPTTAVEQCKVLNRVLFHEYGFRGDIENYYNPANSFLPEVIRRRKGLPITLAMVYLLVAERCGIQLEPVGIPGKFMVGCFLDDEPFYIDVFERGAFREREDIHFLLRSHNIDYEDAFFMPTPVGEVLCRCCRNLVAAYERSGEVAKRDLFRSFVDAFDHAYREDT